MSTIYDRLQQVERSEVPNLVRGLSAQEQLALAEALYDWEGAWARPNQREPEGEWTYWLLKAGRGFGKTRVGAEMVRHWAEAGSFPRIALVGATAADVRDIMVEGESGVLAVSPPWFQPIYEPSKRRLTWPNGVIATCYSADRPDRLRGPQHYKAWADELAAWRYPDAWDQLLFGLRLGEGPQCVVTTTPKPVRMVRELIADPLCRVTSGSTFENRANLAPAFYRKIVQRYKGTSLGRQELYAELLEESEGALWRRAWIEGSRVEDLPGPPVTVVVAIDPAASAEPDSSETGIVAACTAVCHCQGGEGEVHGFLLRDRSARLSPDGWARAATGLFHEFRADHITAEKNNGGDMVRSTIRTSEKTVPVRLVWASRGKAARAEPIAALYEQGRIHHVGGFGDLEDQLCNWEPGTNDASPDRLDAAVWAFSDLMLKGADLSTDLDLGRGGRSYWKGAA